MPPLDAGDHLLTYLFDVGPTMAGEALTFSEISAWTDLTGHCLSAWEASTLRRLSSAYASEYALSSEPARLPPYAPADRVVQVDPLARMASILDRLADQDAKTRT